MVVERACSLAPACCGMGDFSVQYVVEHVVTDGIIASPTGEAAIETVIDTSAASQPVAEPRPPLVSEPEPSVAVAEPRAAGLEPVVPPPTLTPAGESSGVQPTSIEEPVAESAAPPPSTVPPLAAPATSSVLAAEPDQPAAEEAAAPAIEPAASVPPVEYPAPAEEAAVTPVTEPEMEEDEPVPGAEATAPAEPPTEEDADAPELPAEPEPVVSETITPEPVVPEVIAPEPAAEVQPEPDNIFEEFDAEGSETGPAGDEEELASEPAAANQAPEEPDVETAADPFGDDPATEPEMIEAEPPVAVGDDEPADPFAGDDPAPTAPASDPEPAADPAPADEPAAADPFVSSEPARRWIDVTGSSSMVATLIEVAADGRCVLVARGRRIAVPVENLSSHDRDYVRQAGVRLAKLRADKAGETAAAAPAPTDTAGL